jgi:vesicle transport through interaction with t-SNAREs 1
MDNSPTALFDSYEQDFQQLVDSLKEKLEGDVKDERTGRALADCFCCLAYACNALVVEQRKAGLRRAEMELDEADEMVFTQPFIHSNVKANPRRSHKWRLRYRAYHNL